MNDKSTKNIRTLDMYERLCEGKVLNKSEEADRFGVNERSIQRDIDDIRVFLNERTAGNTGEKRTVEYDRLKKGFVMSGERSSMLNNSEILAVCKILLESRAFTKNEISDILDKLISGCVPKKYVKQVSDLVSNEKFHYVELHEQSSIQDKLWELGSYIKECSVLKITYEKKVSTKEIVKRIIEPVALIFSEYYFYLNAYIMEENGSGEYVRRYEYPAVFRVDRIREVKPTGDRFRIEYADRFEEGEFRKRIQFMFAGELIRLEFKYFGRNVEAVLDRLPTASVAEQNGDEYLIQAEVYGTGILMWLLSQGPDIEVVGPESLREQMKSKIGMMMERYEGRGR